MSTENYIITIGRQLGSGGSSIGKEIADHFEFHYIDKEVLVKASEKLKIPQENLEWIEEKNFSILGSLLQTSVYELPYISEEWYMPTGRQLYETQSQIMKKAAKESPCVIVGRCGAYLFRNHPKHISIFLHADVEHRIERLKDRLDFSGDKAKKIIEKADKERAKYYNTYTGKKWLDLTGYNLCIDSGLLDDKQLKDVIVKFICRRFPELSKYDVF